jgi:hypothetical protein
MTTNKRAHRSDQLAVAGGVDLPDHLVRIPDDDHSVPHDALSQTLHALLTLHPDIELNFRDEDIAKMDDSTKSLLIGDVQRVLQIGEFKADTL